MSDADPGDTSYFIAAGDGFRHRIFPGVEICTNPGRAMMLSVVAFEPGSIVPDHAHPHEQTCLYPTVCIGGRVGSSL